MIHCEVEKCVGCRMCEVACSAFHFGGVSPALARIRVAKLESTGIDMAIACLSCVEKHCLVCPTEALSVGDSGEIVLDADLCDGCPIGAVGFHDGAPLFCGLCAGEITCVGVCPTGALTYREDVEVSLETCPDVRAGPSARRAIYAQASGEPVRRAWTAGVRVDG
jgi:Fe-S-cluster-containing hydrogenase component 2